MHRTLLTTAATLALVAGADAATATTTLNFTNMRLDRAGWSSSEGETIALTNGLASTSGFSATGGTLTATANDFDIFGDTNSYDLVMTIVITGNGISVPSNGIVQLGLGDSVSYATPTLTIYEAGTLNVASNVTVDAFNGFFDARTSIFGVSDTGSITNSGATLNQSLVSGLNTYGPTSDVTFTNTPGGDAININSISGGFTVTAVPEPSSTALLGLGGLALILRRRK